MFGVAVSAAFWFVGRGEDPELPEASNPAELKAALAFGALYDVVLLAVAFARDRFGTAGLYTVAGVPAPAALPQAIGPSGA